jgi:hypothetical protein
MTKNKFVVVTTDEKKRGVFAGYLKTHDGDTVTLKDAQMAVSWSAETRGVLGLAAIGPQPTSLCSGTVRNSERILK